MARPAKFTDAQFLDAALDLIAEDGPAAATMAAIAARVGAPVGSAYHRFPSRDDLVARAWVRSVARFQAGYLSALDGDDLDTAALDAALHPLRWARENLLEARLLMLRRREDLADEFPPERLQELSRLDVRVTRAIRAHARRRFGSARQEHVQRTTFALVDVPAAALRRHLSEGVTPPPVLDGLVTEATSALLQIPEMRVGREL